MPKKKKAPAKKAKKTEEGSSKIPPRATMEDVVKTHIELHNVKWIRPSDEFDYFAFKRLFTGLIPLDLTPIHLGKRISIIGDESVGKTLICYILEAAAMRTCRYCKLPIIPWINNKTGEIKTACGCGKCAPMVVIHLDSEDSFDPLWAKIWGVDVDGIEEEMRDGYKLRINAAKNYWVATPMEGDAAFLFIEDAVKSGAADFVVIDSLAMLVPKESYEDKDGVMIGIDRQRISPEARMSSKGVARSTRAQIVGKLLYDAKPTIVWTNQYYLGPTRNPREDPRRQRGGKRVAYAQDTQIKILSMRLEDVKGREGIDHATRYGDIMFEIYKQKAGATPKARGTFRVYLDNMEGKTGTHYAGETNQVDLLLSYLEQIGLFKKVGGSHYEVLGRKFGKVKDIRAFLSRRDIQYLATYYIARTRLSVSAIAHIEKEDYGYCPWGPDPSFVLFEETLGGSAAPAAAVPPAVSGDSEDGKTSSEEEDESWLEGAFEPDEQGQP